MSNNKGDKWKELKLDYGLGTIYDPIEIENMKNDVEFPRKMMCQYVGKIGNTFSPININNSVQRYIDMELDKVPISQGGQYFCGCDFGSGDSKTALVVTNHLIFDNKDIIRVVYAEEVTKPSGSFVIDLCHNLRRQFDIGSPSS